MNWQNIGLIATALAAIGMAAVALYRMRPQKELDSASKSKIEEEVKRLQTAHDRRRTIRLLRLERYIDQDITYHRQSAAYQRTLVELVERCIAAGLLPEGTHLGDPPDPPELPEMMLDETLE